MSVTANTVGTGRRWDRSSWLTLAFVVGFAATCTLVTALILREPGDGCLIDLNSGAIYVCVGDWATPLRSGDRVLAVAGVTMVEGKLVWADDDRLQERADEAALPYVVERGGERLELEVPLGRLDGPGLLRAFGAGLTHYGVGWLLYTCVGAAIIFALAPRSRAAQLLLIVCGSGSAVTTLAWTAESIASQLLIPTTHYLALLVIATFWGWLLLPTLLLLVLSFPRRVWPLSRWPRATPILLYGVPLAALLATLISGDEGPYLAGLGVGAVSFLGAILAVTIHTVWRVRDPVVRAQTAWLGLGLLVGIGIWPLIFVAGPAVDAGTLPPWLDFVIQIASGVGFAVCLGIAITRYRLFDINVVINRALVYSLLTAALAAVYFGGVVAVQSLFRSLTGQESELAIVAATLAVAGLFQPLRGRVQGVIDRLFFRRKYNAAQVLASYGLALREDADLETLSDGLLRVTDETMRPAHISLWMRETDGRE